jgi:formylglycine-generating enzyme required for sulfatase activity
VADSRIQALQELVEWWVSQGGEPGDSQGFADWLWLNASLRGHKLPRRFTSSGGLAHPDVHEVEPPPQRVTTNLEESTPDTGAIALATSEPYSLSVFPPEPGRVVEGSVTQARLLSSALLPNNGDVKEQFQRRTGVVPLLLRQMPLLQRSLPLLMALQPLLQKQPHPRWRDLDEEGSAERSAELDRPWPVFRARRVPTVEVHLWLDAGVAMAVWWPLAQDLQHLLASSQAFARVVLHRFKLEMLPDSDTQAAQDRQRSDGTALHLMLSDTAGRHWWDGSMGLWLKKLTRQHPVAVLHTLPIRYQARTALRRGDLVTLSNSKALGPTSGYQAVPVASVDPRRRMTAQPLPLSRGLKLPVVSLDQRDLAPWAALVMGDGLARSSGRMLPLPDKYQTLPLPEQTARPETQLSPSEAVNLWQSFCQQASPEARQLMRLMAAAPLLTLPVLRLLMAAELPDQVAPLPLAEVLVSGLVHRCNGDHAINPDQVQFEMLPAVQELLEADLEPNRRVGVIRNITDLLERHWNLQGRGNSFQSLVTDPRTPLPPEAEGLAHFANVTAAMLDRLPGQPFRDLARDLRTGTGAPPPPIWPSTVVFNEMEFETAQLLDVPDLETFEIVTARFESCALEQMTFETAVLAVATPADRKSTSMQAVSVHRFSRQNWGFKETLGDAGSLNMLEIPAGSFLMGSPDHEPDRPSDEGPQHTVDLDRFFMSQTPITQAQWRVVAQWQELPGEHWGRELQAEPSAMGGPDADQKPVETVSWHDAMEFCHRLSQRTGRQYTLPSEAQWEYACRAGTTTPFHFGETITPDLANYDANYTYANGPKGEYRKQTTPVGLFPANAWGLQDMHGNVWEWCLDQWHESYAGAPSDGSAWVDSEDEKSGVKRLRRGGSWLNDPSICRSASRPLFGPVVADDLIGFRVVCLPQDPSLNT